MSEFLDHRSLVSRLLRNFSLNSSLLIALQLTPSHPTFTNYFHSQLSVLQLIQMKYSSGSQDDLVLQQLIESLLYFY